MDVQSKRCLYLGTSWYIFENINQFPHLPLLCTLQQLYNSGRKIKERLLGTDTKTKRLIYISNRTFPSGKVVHDLAQLQHPS